MNAREFSFRQDDSFEELIRKSEALITIYRESPLYRKFLTFFDADAAAGRFEALLPRLRAAIADPSLAEDVRLEATAVWAEDLHESALVVVALSHHIHHVDDATRARWARDGMTEGMADLARRLDEERPFALTHLTTEDKAEFREHGMLRPGE